MAFLPSFQEAIQSHTGGILYFLGERDKSSQLDLSPDVSNVEQGYLEFSHSWGRNDAWGYMLNSVIGETKALSPTILCEPFPPKFSSGEVGWKTWLGYTLASPGFPEKQQIVRRVGTITTWQYSGKVLEGYNRLVLDLQDLLVRGQIWNENSLLLAGYPSTNARPLEQVYHFRKPVEVSLFLEMNPFLIPLLEEAYDHIRKYFPSSNLFLEVIADPEVIDERQLIIFIDANHGLDEASEALDRLDKDWWLDVMERAQEKLCITLEFQ